MSGRVMVSPFVILVLGTLNVLSGSPKKKGNRHHHCSGTTPC